MKASLLLSTVLLGLCGLRAADEALPPAKGQPAPKQTGPVTPTAEQLAALQGKLATLHAAIQALKDARADDDLVVDVEATAWVVHNTLRVSGAFVNDTVIGRCLSSMDDALRRAQEIKAGTAAWPKLKGQVNRAHRSAVDGTAQPYALTIPSNYDPARPIALYVYLHGRSQYNPDTGWTWVGGNDRERGAREGNYIRVNAFGRGNNSFRWAGETDVMEVIASVRKRYNIDPDRILLAGFSMGGAGAWQLGLHRPDLFCGLEINAGVIPPASRNDLVAKATTAHYGTTVDHALAVSHIPLVAFAGENDAQLAASVSVREQLVREGFAIEQASPHVWKGKDIDALFLVHPDAGHAHPTGETQRLRDEYNAANFQRGRVVPDRIRFVTYATRYGRDHWLAIEGLERHFDRATVDATRDAARVGFTVKTSNVSRLRLSGTAAARTVTIDGETLQVTPAESVLLLRENGRWKVGDARAADAGLRKRPGLQGPVNDAFLDAFLCVTPTGQAFNHVAAARGREELARFSQMFTREFCGEVRTTADTALTDADIAGNHLVLFGDPGSNRVLARIADRLPITWTRESIVIGGKAYSAAEHVPVFIYPNPLNPQRYIIVNAGLSAQGRGAQTFADFAILKAGATDATAIPQVVAGGTFDENWKVPNL